MPRKSRKIHRKRPRKGGSEAGATVVEQSKLDTFKGITSSGTEVNEMKPTQQGQSQAVTEAKEAEKPKSGWGWPWSTSGGSRRRKSRRKSIRRKKRFV